MNHKSLVSAIVSIFFTCVYCVKSQSLDSIKTDVTFACVLAEKTGCRNLEILVDNYKGLRDKNEFMKLEQELIDAWEPAILRLDYIAPTDMEKAVLMLSCGSLSSREYIKFLLIATDMVEKGDLDTKLYSSIQCPHNEKSDAWAVLAKNYKDPDVIDIIERSKAIFHDQPERIVYYDRILSGENCKGIHEYEKKMYGEINPFNTPETNLRSNADKVKIAENIAKRPFMLGLILIALIFVGVIIFCRLRPFHHKKDKV